MLSPWRRVLPFMLALSLLLAMPAGAQAKRMKAPARKFLAQQDRLQKRLAPKEKQMLRDISAMRRRFKACPVLSDLPNDGFQQIKSFLYVLLDMIQETTEPFKDDLAYVARSYRKSSYGDGVLNRAGRERYRHFLTLSELKPFDSCAVLDDWAQAKWPSDWKPTGEAGVASDAMYDPDVQIPDEGALLRRLRKLGASSRQRSRTKNAGISERVLDGYDKVLAELFPKVDIEWR